MWNIKSIINEGTKKTCYGKMLQIKKKEKKEKALLTTIWITVSQSKSKPKHLLH